MVRRVQPGNVTPLRWIGRPRVVAALAVLVTLLSMGAAYWVQRQQNQTEIAERFELVRTRVLSEVMLRMQQYEYGLRGARGAVAAVGDGLNWSAFARYAESRDFKTEFPGALGFGWIRRVTSEAMPGFLENARAEAGASFEIRRIQPHDGDSYVIQYIEPLERNLRALGLDIASEPARHAAAVASMQTGEPALTGPISLLQSDGQNTSGLLILLPVYRHGMPTNTPASRERALVGWVYAPLDVAEVLRNIDEEFDHFTMTLRDQASPPGVWLYGPASAPALPGARERSVSLYMIGRQWEADLQPTREFVDSLRQTTPEGKAAEAGVVGLLLAALVVAMLHLAHRGRTQRLEQARRAAIVEGSEDAIIVQTLQGVITDWNDGARRLFGYSADEVLGCTVQELLVPPDLKGEDESMLALVSAGRRVKAYDTVRSHRDGGLIEVSISAGPITDSGGRVVGLAKTLRDVREVRAAARRVAELNATLEDQVRERTADLELARHALQTVLDAMPSQIGYWSPDLRNQVVNRAYGEWFHIDPRQVNGMHMRELIGPQLFDDSLRHAQAALAGEARMFEQTHPAAGTGSARHTLVHYLPDVQDGAVMGFYALVHDVTELTDSRMQLAAAQRDNAAMLETLNHHMVVSVADPSGRIVDVNDAFCKLSGYTRDELLGRDHRIVNSGVHGPAFWGQMWQTVRSGRSWRQEVCNRAKDGSLYWVDSVVAPFIDAKGQIEKFVSIRADITERKRTQMELQRTLSLLRAVLEASTQVAIVATDARGVVSLLNRGAELLLGMQADAAVGHVNAGSFLEQAPAESGSGADGAAVSVLLPRDGATSAEWLQRATLEAQGQWYMVRADASRVPVSLAVTRMEDVEGQFVGYLGIASDIRQQLAQEQSLRVAMQQANAASEAKSRFLANMSHEIRTPMNAVLGLSYLLARTPLDCEQQGMLTRLQVAGKALLAVINDILDLSKIEAGEMALEQMPLDLNQVAREAAAVVELQATAKGLSLAVQLDEGLPASLEGDSTRLQQILINLLSNAIKFTEHGEVRLAVERLPGNAADETGDADAVGVRISVSDTGIGIDQESCQRLFSPFVQADLSTTRRYGGTGLGLSIVKQLAEMMRGSVQVYSTPGEGSQFVVTLSMRRGAMPAATGADGLLPGGLGLTGVRLLVVDDNDINREVATRVLQSEGAGVDVAENGRTALDMLQGRPGAYDAVLMDVHMPVLNGLDATHQMRAIPGFAHLPVIGLTAGVSLSEQAQALAAGMNAVVGKPFDPPALVRTIRRCLAAAAGAGADIARPAMLAEPVWPAPVLDPRVPDDWPRLAGVSAAVSHARLKGYQPLFFQLAQRILGLVDAFPETDGALLARDLPTLAQTLHDLKGMTGSMGATALYDMVASAEKAAREGDDVAVATLLPRLRNAVHGWRVVLSAASAVPPTVSAAPDGPAAAQVVEDPGLAERIGQFRQALASRDLAALDAWTELSGPVERWWGAARVAELQGHLDALEFVRAAALVDACLPTAHAGHG